MIQGYFIRLLLAYVLATGLLYTPTAYAVLELDHADVARVQGERPPEPDASWSAQSLPDQWSISRPGFGGDVWYRLRFDLGAVPQEEMAVYLPHLCMNAAVYLNGMFLGDGGSFDDPVGRNWNRPLLFIAPPALLQKGENTLLIRVHSPNYSLGSLGVVNVGSHNELRPLFEDRLFWRTTLAQSLTMLIAAMGLMMLVLWWLRRQDTMYGLFGLSSLIWAFNSSNLFLQQIPFPARLWETLIQASFQVFISLLMISLLRFLDLRKPMLERALWFILLASPVSLLLIPDAWFSPISVFWHMLTMLSSAWVLAYLLRAAVRERRDDALLLLLAMGINLVFGVHDWLKQATFAYSGEAHWLQYGGPVFFLMVGGILTNRFVQALNQYERLSSELEQRVRDNRAELKEQFEHLQQIEKQKAAMQERERIFRDLHDDMGAKLLGLTISAQRANRPAEADLARSALQDLRDVVSRSADSATPLDDLLADWRIETEQRVRAAGLVLDWRFLEQDNDIMVPPEVALNMSRILREAVTNVLRHAQAANLRIDTRLDGQQFFVSIADDGIGLPTQVAAHRGMSSMQARAAALGATLDWCSQGVGCLVEFRVPLSTLTP